jgi:hypothetical protein
MFLDKIPGGLLEHIRADSLMKASFMASRVSSATEFTWERKTKEGSINGPLSPKPKGGGKGGGAGGAGSPLSPSKGTFSSPGSMALARMSLAEGLTGYGDAMGSVGSPGGSGGSPRVPPLAPVVRHNREVSTARSVLRHSLRGAYNGGATQCVCGTTIPFCYETQHGHRTNSDYDKLNPLDP